MAMASYNRVIIMGNLTRDPEYKQLASGQAVCRLGLASNRQYRSRQSDAAVQEVCFIDVDVWGAQAESCRQYLQKGKPVMVEGRLKFDTWQDNNGQTRSKHSIVADRVMFLWSGADASESATEGKNEQPQDEASLQLEKGLLDQIEQIKTRASVKGATKIDEHESHTKKKSPKKDTESSETTDEALNFKDEPPFQDDLPF
jgi:single-strand DNA-binding protein